MTGQTAPAPWTCPGCEVVYKIPAGKRPPARCPACRRKSSAEPPKALAVATPLPNPEPLTEFVPAPRMTLWQRLVDVVTLGALRRWLLAELLSAFRLLYMLAGIVAAVILVWMLLVAIRVTLFGPLPYSEPRFSSREVSPPFSATSQGAISSPTSPAAEPEPKTSFWGRFRKSETEPDKPVKVRAYVKKDGTKVEAHTRKKATRD